MKKTVICGGKKLQGEVTVHGAKNSILPILAAVILSKDDIYLENCPPLKDITAMLELLEDIGCRTEFENGRIHIDPRNAANYTVDDALMHKLRSSIFILGPLIARLKRAEMGYPGGCDIGIRPIDLHLKGLRDLGVNVSEKDGHIICTAEKLTGSEVYLDYPSVGATENIMMASSLADGATVIYNAAKEPEIDAYVTLNEEGALKKAAEVDEKIAKGEELGKLAKPFHLRIEGPMDCDCDRETQIEALAGLTAELDKRGCDVELVADEWCNTLEDIKLFADAKAGHMVQIKTPDLGGVNNTIEAVLYCKQKGIGAYQGGTCNETDRSAQVCVNCAMATQPDQILAKPGMGVDEGYMIVYNEMQRILALRAAKKAAGK